jgi:hypothetical protein
MGDDDDGEAGTDTPDTTKSNAWPTSLCKWLKDCQPLFSKSTPSSVLLGKVWVRLFFGLENIAKAMRPVSKNASFVEVMELYALCVVNAFLVEESSHHLHAESPSVPASRTAQKLKPWELNNPQTSAADYISQFWALDEQDIAKEKLPLTWMVATCPLMTGLIQKSSLDEWGSSFIFNDDDFAFLDDSSAKILVEVSIQGRKPEPEPESASEQGTATRKSTKKPQKPPVETPPSAGANGAPD